MKVRENTLTTCNAALKVTFFPIYFLCRTLVIFAVKGEELSTGIVNPFPRNLMKIIKKRDIERIETKEDENGGLMLREIPMAD
jgi:hypothetical protein